MAPSIVIGGNPNIKSGAAIITLRATTLVKGCVIQCRRPGKNAVRSDSVLPWRGEYSLPGAVIGFRYNRYKMLVLGTFAIHFVPFERSFMEAMLSTGDTDRAKQ